MTSLDSIYEIFQYIRKIYQFGDRTILIQWGSFSVTVNQFWLVIAIFGIVFSALLTFAKSYTSRTISVRNHVKKDKAKD